MKRTLNERHWFRDITVTYESGGFLFSPTTKQREIGKVTMANTCVSGPASRFSNCWLIRNNHAGTAKYEWIVRSFTDRRWFIQPSFLEKGFINYLVWLFVLSFFNSFLNILTIITYELLFENQYAKNIFFVTKVLFSLNFLLIPGSSDSTKGLPWVILIKKGRLNLFILFAPKYIGSAYLYDAL